MTNTNTKNKAPPKTKSPAKEILSNGKQAGTGNQTQTETQNGDKQWPGAMLVFGQSKMGDKRNTRVLGCGWPECVEE